MADRVGQQLGNYRLISLLGNGGFADVYLGEHIHLGTEAAIKVLRTQLTDEDVEKFRTEACIIARLRHPHIIRVLDFGVENNTAYLVMDYAPNGTLRAYHPCGSQLEISSVVSYVKQIASALQDAHNQKIVHGDVKPDNMLLGQGNKLLLSDFGMAVVINSTSSKNTSGNFGTPHYMAPEQILGHPLPESDQYALGIVVYEWLCGECPFNGSLKEVASQHLYASPPSLRKKVLAIPPSIEEAVLRALEKDPQKRFPSVQEFANALEQSYRSKSTIVLPATSASLPIAPANHRIYYTVTEPNLLPQTKYLDELYAKGMQCRKENPEQAESFWQQIIAINPYYGASWFANQRKELLEELIRRQRRKAIQARDAGNWQQEIKEWKALLQRDPNDTEALRLLPIAQQNQLRQEAIQASDISAWRQAINTWGALQQLDPNDTEASRCLTIARQNQQYEQMYKKAKQFAEEDNISLARDMLRELWYNAPHYGDPEKLAKKVGLLDYQKARAAGFKNPVWIRITAFCLLGGLSSLIGFLTQSLLLLVVSLPIVFLLAYLAGYRKVTTPKTMCFIAVLSGALACGATWSASQFNYSETESITHIVATVTTDASSTSPTDATFTVDDYHYLWLGGEIGFIVVSGAGLAFLISFACTLVRQKYSLSVNKWSLLITILLEIIGFLIWISIYLWNEAIISHSLFDWGLTGGALFVGEALLVGSISGIGVAMSLPSSFAIMS